MGSINIVSKIRILGDDNITQAIVDQYTQSLNTINVEHNKIHQGKGFTFAHECVVPAEGEKILLLDNPIGNYPHLRYYAIETTGAPAEICFHREPTVSVQGTLASLVNNNLNSANTPNLQLYEDTQLSDYGVELDCDFIVGGKFEGGSASPTITEWVLVPGEKYALVFKNNSGISIDLNIHLFFYE